jgi:hypothetical protein
VPKRRTGIKKNSNANLNMPKILQLVEGFEFGNNISDHGSFKNFEEMKLAWKNNKTYLTDLFIIGSEKIGGYGPGKRPAGFWLCESDISNYFTYERSGIVADEVFLDGKCYNSLSNYALLCSNSKPEIQFKLNQYKYLKDNQLLFKWEKKKIKEIGLPDDWITKKYKELKNNQI